MSAPVPPPIEPLPGRPATPSLGGRFAIDPSAFPQLHAAMTAQQVDQELKAADDKDLGDIASAVLTSIAEFVKPGRLRTVLLVAAKVIKAVL